MELTLIYEHNITNTKPTPFSWSPLTKRNQKLTIIFLNLIRNYSLTEKMRPEREVLITRLPKN